MYRDQRCCLQILDRSGRSQVNDEKASTTTSRCVEPLGDGGNGPAMSTYTRYIGVTGSNERAGAYCMRLPLCFSLDTPDTLVRF